MQSDCEKGIRKFDTHNKGAVAMVFALSLPVLMAFMAICLNAGRLYVTKQMMQNSVDAAAEAIGASAFATCSSYPWWAQQAAQIFFVYNFERQSRWVTSYDATGYFGVNVSANNISIGACDSYGRLPVIITANVPIWLGGFLGKTSVTITAQAFATFSYMF